MKYHGGSFQTDLSMIPDFAGQVTVPDDLSRGKGNRLVAGVSVGWEHSCAISLHGHQVSCWGNAQPKPGLGDASGQAFDTGAKSLDLSSACNVAAIDAIGCWVVLCSTSSYQQAVYWDLQVRCISCTSCPFVPFTHAEATISLVSTRNHLHESTLATD